MKKILTLTLVFIAVCMHNTSNGQNFTYTLENFYEDFTHYSIELSPSGRNYAVAGTMTDMYGDTKMHLLFLDINGSIIWERTINNSRDDRIFDVAFDDYENMVIAGHSEVMNNNVYLAKYDAGGTFLGDYILEISWGPMNACSGTNIIYSRHRNAYIVGGLVGARGASSPGLTYPLMSNQAFVASIPLDFNACLPPNWVQMYAGSDDTHSAINDIVELQTGDLFITGSVGIAGPPLTAKQGVLAAVIDGNFGGLLYDHSFESTNYTHTGVSAAYDVNNDEMWLMSNNSVIHNPQINSIRDVSQPHGQLLPGYFLELDATYGSYNAAGFKLVQSKTNPRMLVAAGHFQNSPLLSQYSIPATQNVGTWIVEFDSYTGMPMSDLLIWDSHDNAGTTKYSAHGDLLFTQFDVEKPYIFNQEMMCLQPSQRGYSFLAPRSLMGNFTLDIVSVNENLNSVNSPCHDVFGWGPIPIPHNSIVTNDSPAPYSHFCFSFADTQVERYIHYFCDVGTVRNEMDISSENISSIIDQHVLRLEIDNPEISASKRQFSIFDASGKLVHQSVDQTVAEFELNVSSFSKGLYLIMANDANDNMLQTKFIIH